MHSNPCFTSLAKTLIGISISNFKREDVSSLHRYCVLTEINFGFKTTSAIIINGQMLHQQRQQYGNSPRIILLNRISDKNTFIASQMNQGFMYTSKIQRFCLNFI